MSETLTPDQIDQMEAQEAPQRVTRRDLVEGKIDKVIAPEKTSLVATGIGGLKFDNAMQMAEAAKLMATAGPLLPPWLQGNVGGCWAVLLRSTEIGVSALTLAQMMFVTEKGGIQRVGYDSVYFRMMVEKFAPIKHRLMARYEGEGDKRKCIVFTTFKGETEPREFPPPGSGDEFTLGKLRPAKNDYGKTKGSPLWDTKPDLQLFYAMSRDWARMYAPDIVAGAYTRDELADIGFVAAEESTLAPRDLAPNRLADRLRAQGQEGFAGERTLASIDEALKEASEPAKEA